MVERCLSFPNIGNYKIRRYKKIKVSFQGIRGKTYHLTLKGQAAQTFQHETDHLNGVLFDKR